MEHLLVLVCNLFGFVGLASFAALFLISLVFWRGGIIKKIGLPGLFEVELGKPIGFGGSNLSLVFGTISGLGLTSLGVIGYLGLCPACAPGLPGETAWINAGVFDTDRGTWALGPFVSPVNASKALIDLDRGDQIFITEEQRTVIPGFRESGTERAMESPFHKEAGAPTKTCRVLNVGRSLLIGRRDARIGEPGKLYVWYRVEEVQ